MDIDYLVQATNSIHSLLLQTYELNKDDLRKAFAIGCHTLSKVNAQTDVLTDLMKLSQRQRDYLDEYKAICGDLDHFVNGFLEIEKEVMIKAGINEEAAQSLINEAKGLRIVIEEVRIDPFGVRQNISKLHSAVCDLAGVLHRLPERRDEQRKARKRLKRYAAGIGGITIVGINASAFVLTLGLSLPGTAVSGGLGSGLIGASLAFE